MTVTLIAILIGAFSLQTNIQPITYARIVALSLILSAILSLNGLYIAELSGGLGLWSGLFHVNPVSLATECLIYLTASFILIPWFIGPLNKKNDSLRARELTKISGPVCSDYSLITLFSVLGATLLISSSDLISMYLSIELQSFAVYILSTLYKDNESAVSSGLKYFLLGGLSSCFILLGAGLLYSYTGLTNIEAIFSLILSSNTSNASLVPVLGLLFIIIGFLFKIAAAPLHNWAPDVYDGVPSIVTTWLTIMPKISIVVFLLELVTVTLLGSSIASINANYELIIQGWNIPLKNVILTSALLSLILGSIVGLAQFKIKRLLAYSTISHVGFLLLALAINSEASTESLLFYLIQYTLSNLNVFLILLAFGYILKSLPILSQINLLPRASRNNTDISQLDIRYIYELKGQFIKNPILSLSFSLMLFSMAGVPPLIGFFAKQQVLLAATQNGYYFLSVVAILVSVVSAYYYLQIIKVMHFSSESISTGLETPMPTHDLSSASRKSALAAEVEASSYISNSHSYLISTLTLGMLLFMLNPNILLNSVHLLALTLFSA